MEKLIAYTAFLFIFYTLSEIIFCNWLFNLAHKVVFEVVAIRTLLVLLIGIFTIVALDFKTYTIPIFGIMFILVGVNIFLYVPVMTVKKI